AAPATWKRRLRTLAARTRAALVTFFVTGKREEAKRREPKNAQWWRRTLTEIGTLFAIIVPIELAVTGGQVGAFEVHPHPYWIVVLPMAGARGAVAGLLAATLSSLLYAIGAMQALSRRDLFDLLDFKTMQEPLLFYGVGFFIGELHDEFAGRFRRLERRLQDVLDRNNRLRQERDVLADANKILERRIVDHSVQFGNLIVAATRIENAGRREVFDVALDLVEEHCGAIGSVLLVLEDRSVDVLCHRGWPAHEVSTRLADARGSEFVQRALAEGVNVSGFVPGANPPERGPLVVAPLFDAAGVVKALLCLDDVPPARLNESTVTIFFGIAEWISASLSRIARGDEAPDPRRAFVPGPTSDLWLGTPEELGERLRVEYERCARYGVPTSVLAIQATEWKDTSEEGRDILDRFILTHFTGGLRPSDQLYRFGYPGCHLLVLGGTTVEGAEVVRTRLLRRVEYSSSKGIGPVEIFATGPDTEAPDLVSLAARVAAQFRKASPLPLEGTCPVPVPDRTKVGGIDGFVRRIKLETSLAVRNGFELHVVGITSEAHGAANANLLARHIEEVAVVCLRPADGAYAIGPHHCALILPSTGGEEAATVAHRLVQALRMRDPNAPYGAVQTQVLGLGPSHPDPGSFLDALAKQRPSAPEPAPHAEAP
ncbi:MAG: hypothetical protein ACREID_09225, partial [Planctomycetota bacterium]